jgi:cobyrinic acid a,c-diamide synthase
MGLIPYQEREDPVQAVEQAEALARTHLDLPRIIAIAQQRRYGSRRSVYEPASCHREVSRGVRIGVLRDAAFQFYYPENIESLEDRALSWCRSMRCRQKTAGN